MNERLSVTDELLKNNERYAERFDSAGLPTAPAKKLAVVACMDSRMDIFAMLGLQNGEAHIIRNAGGVVTDDEIRSLSISQRLLGTEEVVVIQHTRCGMLTFTDDEFKQQLEEDAGVAPEWDVHAFDDLDESVRRAVRRIKESPFIPHRDRVRGFVYDVETGKLREVP